SLSIIQVCRTTGSVDVVILRIVRDAFYMVLGYFFCPYHCTNKYTSILFNFKKRNKYTSQNLLIPLPALLIKSYLCTLIQIKIFYDTKYIGSQHLRCG